MAKKPPKPAKPVKPKPAPRRSARPPAPAAPAPAAAPIAAITHRDSRVNIPTEDLRDFYHNANPEPPPPTLYPRNPDLDPQLVWRGKDEQDRADLAVPLAPIYIQEKVHPQAIIEDFKHTAPKPKGDEADGPGLFADHYSAFNGLPKEFADRVDFYHHQGHWQNRLILGDSLLVMNSLAEKEGLKGKVQMVYFDPPYGIKFGSNWQVSTRKRDVKDGKSEDVVRQPEQMRAFRDTWELGIHSYLAYLRDRLTTARELLTESGSIFVQIGDENVHRVRAVMDEVFGDENSVSTITFKTTTGAGSFAVGTNVLPSVSNYLIWYAKNKEQTKYRQVYLDKEVGGAGGEGYTWVENDDGKRWRASPDQLKSTRADDLRVFAADNLTSQTVREAKTTVFPVSLDGRTFVPGKGGWKTNPVGMSRLQSARRLIGLGNTLRYVRFFDDFPVFPVTNLWDDTTTAGFADEKMYVVQTNAKVIERCIQMSTDPGDLVLDPTCGSGTTAHVAEQWGRRWITTDTSRVALTLARTRLMGARFPAYYLADQYPQVGTSTDDDAIRDHLRKATPAMPVDKADLRRGFVYKRVPHVTLKSIANNPDVKEGMSRDAIDRAIKKHADTEVLYDKPFPNDKAIRVCGPFTVESLSPHRQLSVHAKVERATVGEADTIDPAKRRVAKVYGPDDFGRMVLENMKRAGVQNTYKHEKMVLESLDPHPGEWIQGSGHYIDKQGKKVRVGVCIGPEHGTVGAELVKEAAKEAVRGLGFDTLLVAGFAFDPSVGEEAKRYGGLTVLPVRINADIAMGELLKKTGAGNLFMIFGEPDIQPVDPKTGKIIPGKDGKVVVEIKGLDVYDPTTGEVRSSSTDDIACWFIDTNYNGEAFFVRHAYFTGADEPYAKLQRALKAEIDETAWSALYSTTSRPFDKPKTGRIAVKVINHFGDEVLKVYDVK